jgi:hypothetical protein
MEGLLNTELAKCLINRDKSNRLSSSFNKLVSEKITDHIFINNYPTHGTTHIESIHRKIWSLFGNSISETLNTLEMYILLCAIHLHDISMVNNIRKEHAKASAEIIRTNYHIKSIIDNSEYCEWIADVVQSHGESDLKKFISENYRDPVYDSTTESDLDISLLMALLRIGDLMDWACDRSPIFVREIKSISGESYKHWIQHSWIKKISPHQSNNLILVKAEPVGPWSANILLQHINWFNAELESNKEYLKKFKIVYDKFELETYSKKKITEALSQIDIKGLPFKPFKSYEEADYFNLFGRDEEVSNVVSKVFGDGDAKTLKIVGGKSGVGKTSLIKSKIVPIAKELGYKTVITSCYNTNDIIEDLARYDVKIDESLIERTLFIFDQFERLTWNEKDFVDIITKLCAHIRYEVLICCTLENVASLQMHFQLIPLTTILIDSIDNKTAINVVNNTLKTFAIPFDTKVVSDIVNELYIVGNQELPELHIVFKKLIEIDRSRLVNIDVLKTEYGSISKMNQTMIEEYYTNLFINLQNNEKKLLLKSCDESGLRAKRATIDSKEEDSLVRLEEVGIIRIFNNNQYEFLHDHLAREFFSRVLSLEEKSVKKITNKIKSATGSIDILTLNDIIENKDKIASERLDDRDIFVIVQSFLITYKNYGEEVKYWIRKIGSLSNLLSETFRFLSDNFNSEYLRRFKPFLLDYIEYHGIDEHLVKSTTEDMFDKNRASSWIDRNLCLHLGNYFNKSDVVLALTATTSLSVSMTKSLPTVSDHIYMNPSYCNLAYEIFYYLKCNNCVIEESQNLITVETGVINDLLALLHDVSCNNNYLFYSEIYKDKIRSIENQEPISLKVNQILQIALNIVTEGLDILAISGFLRANDAGCLSIVNSSSQYILAEIDVTEKQKLIRYSLNEQLKLLVKSEGCSYVPIAGIKTDSHLSNTAFFEKDVEHILWRSKTSLNRYEIILDEVLNEVEKKFHHTDWVGLVDSYLCKEQNIKKISSVFEENKYVKDNYSLKHDKLRYLYGVLTLLNIISIKHPNKLKSCKIHLLCQSSLSELPFFNNFYFEFSDSDNIDPFRISGNGPGKKSIDYCFNKGEPCVIDVVNISHMCTDEIVCTGMASPILFVYIGNKLRPISDCYSDSVSFIVEWEDRVNRVSKAIDAWEYEISKILHVLDKNSFITNIVIVGAKEECPKAISFLEHIGKYGKLNDMYHEISLFWEESSIVSLLNGKHTKIFDCYKTTSMEEVKSDINKHFYDVYNTFSSSTCNTVTCLDTPLMTSFDELKEQASQYVLSEMTDNWDCSGNLCNKYIKSCSLDTAHKHVVAKLINSGKEKVDSCNKGILELLGLSIEIEDTDNNKLDMKFRETEIREYYSNQWVNLAGDIRSYVDNDRVFSVGQKSKIIDMLVVSVSESKNTRKASFTFYDPESSNIPSLFSAFLLPDIQGEYCKLHSFFVWRTNECVFGLPLSLEACIKWVKEEIVPELQLRLNDISNLKVLSGNYTYYGVNMHCYNNGIMRDMISKLLSSCD